MTATAPGKTGRSRLFRWLRLILGAIIVLAACYFLYRRLSVDWSRLRAERLRINAWYVAASYLVLLLFHFPLGALCWRTILRGLGERLPFFRCLVIMTVTQIGKYAPGKVWFTLGRMSFAKQEGVPEDKSLVSVAIEIGFALLAAVLLFAVAVLVLLLQHQAIPAYVYALFGLIPLCLVIVYPPVLNRLLQFLLPKLRRPVFTLNMTYPQVLGLLGLYVLDWLVQGAGSILLIKSFYPLALPLAKLPVLIGGYALAWILGFIVLVAPAGLGVKEFFYGAVTRNALGAYSNISGIIERVWMTTSELLMALICLPFLRRAKPGPQQGG